MVDGRTISETDIQTSVERVMGGLTNIILDSQVMTTLMSCPRLEDLRFNHNLVSLTGKSNSLECGQIFHVYAEYYYKAIIHGLSKTQAHGYGMTAAQLYVTGCMDCTGFVATPEQPKPKCGHKPDEFPGVKNTPKDSEGYKIGWSFALQTCEEYHAYWLPKDHWVPLEVEVVKGKVLYQDDEIRVLWKAKLDLVCDSNQGIYTVDHKTMKQRREISNLNNQFSGQCLIQDTRSIWLNKVGFQKSLKPEERFTREPINYTAERLYEWQSQTLPYYAKLLMMYAETGHFPPNYTNCDGKFGPCVFKKHVCEANPSMREEEIKLHFKVGPKWNPTNDDDGD